MIYRAPGEGLDQATRKRLSNLLPTLEQGAVIVADTQPILMAPAYPLFQSGDGVDGTTAPLVVRIDQTISGRFIVVSQDCDLERDLELEPYLLLAPLMPEEDPEIRERARDGRRSSRLFLYPPIEGADDLVLDVRIVVTLEKTALLDEAAARLIQCPLSAPQRELLTEWLGNRFGRFAFPEEIEKSLVRPIEAGNQTAAKEGAVGRVLACAIYYGLRYTPSRGSASFLIVLDSTKRARQKVDEAAVKGAKRLLEGAIRPKIKNGYSLSISLIDAEELPASELLSHIQLPFDIDL